MATKIRLKRIGRRNRPFYRMVIMDSRKKRDGAAVEELGWYNPVDLTHSFDLKDERILHWLSKGAEPTKAAKKLLRRSGLNYRWHLMNQGLSESDIEKEMKKWELNREEVLKNRAEKSEKRALENKKDAKEDKNLKSSSLTADNEVEGKVLENIDTESNENEDSKSEEE